MGRTTLECDFHDLLPCSSENVRRMVVKSPNMLNFETRSPALSQNAPLSSSSCSLITAPMHCVFFIICLVLSCSLSTRFLITEVCSRRFIATRLFSKFTPSMPELRNSLVQLRRRSTGEHVYGQLPPEILL